MQHFSITVSGAGAKDGVYRDVEASSPAVALKRVLDGGYQAGYKFATVAPGAQAKLEKDQKITVEIRRWA